MSEPAAASVRPMWDFSFYETSAQIIPVLYLAILVEYRLLGQRWREHRPWARALLATAAFQVALVFAWGEFYALDVVSRGPDEVPTSPPTPILTAYLITVGMLVWPLSGRAIDAQEEIGRLWGWVMLLAGAAAFFVVYRFVGWWAAG
jgi:hypothetical protein